MRISLVPVLGAAASLAMAQDPVLGNAAGVPFPLGSVAFPVTPPTTYTVPLALAPNGNVYASLDGSLPTGRYLFDVVDVEFNNLSHLPALDRVFLVVNNGNGTFTMTRESGTAGLPGVGVGVSGGDSMPLAPFHSPQPIAGRPDLLCVQKMLLYSLDQSGVASFIGFRHFRVGDGSPGSVSGVVFNDGNQNGVRDAGEAGLAGFVVHLVSNSSTPPGQLIGTAVTGANGAYLFANVGIDDCSVVLQLNSQVYTATTPTDVRLANCGCASQVVDFGLFTVSHNCMGRTPGFWRNNNGVALIQSGGFWDELVALNLVNASGAPFDPTGNVQQWRSWLQGANATNMAYMLSAHLAAMQLNVLSGGVSPNCWVTTSSGPTSIAALMAAANAALALDPYTPAGDPNRALQEALKNALDAANNNLNWL
jgi:hypothetical protein